MTVTVSWSSRAVYTRNRDCRAWRRSVVVAAAVLTLNAAAETVNARTLALAGVAMVVVTMSLVPLTPTGTLRLARRLPSDVALRALGFAAFSGAEIYLPRFLTEREGFSPTLAGLSVTVAGLTWFVGSSVQGRWHEKLRDRPHGYCCPHTDGLHAPADVCGGRGGPGSSSPYSLSWGSASARSFPE